MLSRCCPDDQSNGTTKPRRPNLRLLLTGGKPLAKPLNPAIFCRVGSTLVTKNSFACKRAALEDRRRVTSWLAFSYCTMFDSHLPLLRGFVSYIHPFARSHAIAPLARGRSYTFLCHLPYMVWAPRPAQRPAFAHRGLFAAPRVVPHSGLSRRMVAHALDCAHNLAAAAPYVSVSLCRGSLPSFEV